MIPNPTCIVTPTGYKFTGKDFVTNSVDPLGAAIKAGPNYAQIQCSAGYIQRAKGPFNGKVGVHVCGWDVGGVYATTILRDDVVGSTDAFIVGNGDAAFVLEKLVLEADDRAGFKTTTNNVGPKHTLLDCIIKGDGSPHDPTWDDCGKWGIHSYQTSKWFERNCYVYSIRGEHGRYPHNIQGDHIYLGGATAMCGGCDSLFVNRQKENGTPMPEGKGNVTFEDHYTEDVCVGQDGSGLTFRGGMANSVITLKRWKGRLGCKAALAAPFNTRICGLLSVDSGPESQPGAGDAAWPGGQKEVHVDSCDLEIGTVYGGVTGAIRPLAMLDAINGVFTMFNTRIKVTRPAGAYPIGLSIRSGVAKVQIGPTGNEYDGWVEWHPGAPDAAMYHSLNELFDAHPECVA